LPREVQSVFGGQRFCDHRVPASELLRCRWAVRCCPARRTDLESGGYRELVQLPFGTSDCVGIVDPSHPSGPERTDEHRGGFVRDQLFLIRLGTGSALVWCTA
jgi:hypothetical protein